MQNFRPKPITNPDLLRSRNALAASFIIVFAEAQRNWLDAVGLACLASSGLLLVCWLGHLSKQAVAIRYAPLAIDFSLVSLLAISLIQHLSGMSEYATRIARMLLFWSPLIAAWWAVQLRDRPVVLWTALIAFWLLLASELAPQFHRLHEQLILIALIALLVRHRPGAAESGKEAEATINLRDALTGLTSPEQFEAELAHLTAIANRYQLPFCLLACRFQEAGNGSKQMRSEPLRNYANAIVDRLRTADTCCAWDRETFVILLPNTTAAQADALAVELAKTLQRTDSCLHIESSKKFSSVEHRCGNDPMLTFALLEKSLGEATSAQDR